MARIKKPNQKIGAGKLVVNKIKNPEVFSSGV
jgi:hypothetical protein